MTTLQALHPAVLAKQSAYHKDFVDEVKAAVATHRAVVVGMAWNPSVGKARRYLAEKGIDHHYIGHGNYLTGWRKRLAVKLWAGWPTFPMVFLNGMLVGGNSDLRALPEDELRRLLERQPVG